MDSSKLQYFQRILTEEKAKLSESISRIEEPGIGDTMSDSLGELSVYDNHPADLGDELFERSKDTALRDNSLVLLNDIERALEKIADGSYGICDRCGAKIFLGRLEAIPWANQCIECQQASEKSDVTPRPLEEVVLEPPFHRTFKDTSDEHYIGFDGEDSLQAVLKYGSSDTPQDIPGSYDYKSLFPNSNEHEGIVDLADSIPVQYDNKARSRENGKRTGSS